MYTIFEMQQEDFTVQHIIYAFFYTDKYNIHYTTELFTTT